MSYFYEAFSKMEPRSSIKREKLEDSFVRFWFETAISLISSSYNYAIATKATLEATFLNF